MRLFVEADEAIGDSLMQTPALRAHRRRFPEVEIVYVTPWDGRAETILRGNPHVGRFMPPDLASVARRPDDRWVRLSAWDALRSSAAARRSMMDGYATQLGVELSGPEDRRLDLALTGSERTAGRALRETLGPRERVVVCGRHSPSCAAHRGQAPNKCFPNAVWCRVAERLAARGYVPVAVGTERDAEDAGYAQWPGPRVYGQPLRAVAGLIADARAVFCVDTGLRFVAAALGTDLACLSGEIPTWLIFAPPSRPDQRIEERLCPVAQIDADRCVDLLDRILEDGGRTV